jgi:hypothetical protein
MPKRVQIQSWRKPGGKKPDNVVIVARPSKWGNPFKIGATLHHGPSFSGRDETVRDADHAVRLFRQWVFNLRSASDIAELRGKDLACYCKLTDACHADVLLELANKESNNAD